MAACACAMLVACNKNEVVEITPPTVSFDKPSGVYNVQKGKKVTITAIVKDAAAPQYTWVNAGGTVVGTGLSYEFTGEETGDYYLTFKVKASNGTAEQKVRVSVVDWARESSVIEYLPAPGQFINEGYTAGTMAAACAYAKERLEQSLYVSLGGFGGSITVGFDRSIANSGGGDDFAILGNSHANSSEPGIVWVMQDENGNGEADDTWYELRGSETGDAGTVQDYSLTYYRPAADGMAIEWTDNAGGSGTIDRMSTHTQAYFPAWVTTATYTLRGTRLKPLNTLVESEWVLSSYGWGYADNYEAAGRKDADKPAANYFSIKNAMRTDGSSVNLEYIDFIKVQTGVNGKSGALGEISTEVCGFIGLNIK